uniref:Uncharacterized protein n=1 Tax=Anguilla anguilla TaxID=7936 RepID=A0A0E9W043_ANGAN
MHNDCKSVWIKMPAKSKLYLFQRSLTFLEGYNFDGFCDGGKKIYLQNVW